MSEAGNSVIAHTLVKAAMAGSIWAVFIDRVMGDKLKATTSAGISLDNLFFLPITVWKVGGAAAGAALGFFLGRRAAKEYQVHHPVARSHSSDDGFPRQSELAVAVRTSSSIEVALGSARSGDLTRSESTIIGGSKKGTGLGEIARRNVPLANIKAKKVV